MASQICTQLTLHIDLQIWIHLFLLYTAKLVATFEGYNSLWIMARVDSFARRNSEGSLTAKAA